jgi:hypothetical protein
MPACITSHSSNNMNMENPIIQPIVCCTTSVANSNPTWNAGSLNPAVNSGIPPVSLQVHLSRCGSCQSIQGGNVVSSTGQQTNQVLKSTAKESDQMTNLISCTMLNAQNSQTTKPRVETPQIRHSCSYQSTSDPEKATKMWDRVAAMKMLDKIKPKTKFSGYLNSMNFERFMKSMEEDMEQEGVPDELKLKWIVEWFSGKALTIVEAKLNNNINEDASVTLSSIKDALQDAYGVEDRDFCANAIITQLV